MTLAGIELMMPKAVQENHDDVLGLRQSQELARGCAICASDVRAKRMQRRGKQSTEMRTLKIRGKKPSVGEMRGVGHPRAPMTSWRTPAKSTRPARSPHAIRPGRSTPPRRDSPVRRWIH